MTEILAEEYHSLKEKSLQTGDTSSIDQKVKTLEELVQSLLGMVGRLLDTQIANSQKISHSHNPNIKPFHKKKITKKSKVFKPHLYEVKSAKTGPALKTQPKDAKQVQLEEELEKQSVFNIKSNEELPDYNPKAKQLQQEIWQHRATIRKQKLPKKESKFEMLKNKFGGLGHTFKDYIERQNHEGSKTKCCPIHIGKYGSSHTYFECNTLRSWAAALRNPTAQCTYHPKSNHKLQECRNLQAVCRFHNGQHKLGECPSLHRLITWREKQQFRIRF